VLTPVNEYWDDKAAKPRLMPAIAMQVRPISMHLPIARLEVPVVLDAKAAKPRLMRATAM
jgi:hypothetical protein